MFFHTKYCFFFVLSSNERVFFFQFFLVLFLCLIVDCKCKRTYAKRVIEHRNCRKILVDNKNDS